MTFITELQALVARLGDVRGVNVEMDDLVANVEDLSDDELVTVLAGVAGVRTCVERLGVIAAGVAAHRSSRELGHGGLAAKRGHRTPAAMIQSITGGTAAAAKKAVTIGESLVAGSVRPDIEPGDVEPGTVRAAWDEPLRRALLTGAATLDQVDAIHGGLGDPPVIDGEASGAVCEVWSIAAGQLIAEAGGLPAEELRARARTVRDMLDPVGAEERFAARYAKRSYRGWTDAAGQRHGHFVFDDEMGAWVDAVIDAALRPRRGGPRFVDSEEKTAADRLEHDPRTNEQLAYDLLTDVFRAGALASAADVFGARQPGVRMMVTAEAVGRRDAFGRMLGTGCLEDGGAPLAGSIIDRNICGNGTVQLTFDRHGNPLDLGREQRLFSRAQRVMLAARDGGCRWPGCTRPPSYCEAHHCDHWQAEQGNTDIDRGILLCRHHHMLLHNNGWHITRKGRNRFVLHPPPGEGTAPIELREKSPWAWLWDPPPPPRRPGWRVSHDPAVDDREATTASVRV